MMGIPGRGTKELTDLEANDMLETLKRHFGEPVMPISRYCDALTTWFRRIDEKATAEAEKDGSPGHVYGQRWDSGRAVRMSILKSNLLARLIYGGEKLRTRPCPNPEHAEHWRGDAEACQCECQGTGWLPEPS